MPTTPKPIEIFYSYSHADEDLRDELEKHLTLLQRQGVIQNWHDRQIIAGTEWGREIDEHLNTADIILLLISADFLASDYCYDIEMNRALERHEAGKARVIPVILRPVIWEGAPFGKLAALPTDAKPVTEWPNRDEAFENIAQGIREAVEELVGPSAGPPSSISIAPELEVLRDSGVNEESLENMTRECFVIMPFSETTEEHNEEYWTGFYKDFIKPALDKHGYKARRSTATPKNIIKGIVQDLQSSNLVLAVLTDCNPNVWYELGVRHSLRKGTIMIIEEGQIIPFDLKSYGILHYSDEDPEKFANELKDHIEQAEKGQPDSPVADFLDPYAGLIYTINRAEGRLREAVTMIGRLCKHRYDEEQLIQSIDDDLQKLWGVQEEVCVIDADREHYRVIYHREPKYRTGQKKPQDLWYIATEWEGSPENRTPRCQSLFNEIKDSEKGLRVVNLLSPRKRTTVFAYERIRQPELIIVVEAHWRLPKS